MVQRVGLGHLIAVFTLGAFAVAASPGLATGAAAGGRGGGGRHVSLRAGGVGGGVRVGPAPGGMGSGGGFGRQVHGGFSRAVFVPPIRRPFLGFHRFRPRSFVFLNVALYPPYSYYPLYPYYPMYPAYSAPYGPSYDAPSLYADPGGGDPADAVQVYTAPAESPPPPPQQPAVPDVPPPPAEDGSVRFEVSPPEAEIILDNQYLGTADVLRHSGMPAAAGRHLLEIRVGVEGTFTEVRVSPHKVTTVRVALDASTPASPKIGWLRLKVTPPGAAIYLDGAFAAVAKSAQPILLPLPPGPHRVQLVMPGYKGYGAEVTVPEEGEAVVSAQLARE